MSAGTSLLCLMAGAALGGPLDPSDLESALQSALSRVGGGSLEFSFEMRDDVCVSGRHGIWFDPDTQRRTSSDRQTRASRWDCDDGPIRVRVEIEDGEIYDVRWWVDYRDRSGSSGVASGAAGFQDLPSPSDESGHLDLGRIDPQRAAAFLLDRCATASGSLVEDLIVPAVLARDAEVWPRLAGLARNTALSRDVRRSAVFWLGQEAGNAAIAQLEDMVEEPGDLEVRKHAVFAISERPDEESIPALLRIVRTSEVPKLRQTALFWLGQKDDPRIVDIFEEILLGAQ